MSRIAVTGAGGFVGRGLVPALRAAGHSVAALDSRVADVADPKQVTPDLFAHTDVVVHLAGLAHREDADAQALHAVNAAGAAHVARASAEARVGRLVLLSTALVHGNRTHGTPITESSPFAPADAYAESKLAGEDAARGVATSRGLELCILRPPLVHGPGAGGNVARLITWARRGRPLPGAAWHNRRSMVARANLAAAIAAAATHPAAAGRAFLVSDGPPVATGAFYAALCRALGRAPRRLPIPVAALRTGLAAAGKGRDLDRLLADFEVDAAAIRAALGWQPPVPWAAAVAESVRTAPASG